ncbi:MAG: heme-binding domain-containing protein [Pyrinomonadaceae bacterium]
MFKKIVKILAIIIVAAFVVIQFFRIDKTNPPVVEANRLEAALAVPADVSMILGRSCADCHSNNTSYPWYSNIQPAAWFLEDHIDQGRRELNLSEFNTYTAKKKKRKLEEVCEMVESGAMPLPSYLWIHRDAALSESERKALCEWAKGEAEKIQL